MEIESGNENVAPAGGARKAATKRVLKPCTHCGKNRHGKNDPCPGKRTRKGAAGGGGGGGGGDGEEPSDNEDAY